MFKSRKIAQKGPIKVINCLQQNFKNKVYLINHLYKGKEENSLKRVKIACDKIQKKYN